MLVHPPDQKRSESLHEEWDQGGQHDEMEVQVDLEKQTETFTFGGSEEGSVIMDCETVRMCFLNYRVSPCKLVETSAL